MRNLRFTLGRVQRVCSMSKCPHRMDDLPQEDIGRPPKFTMFDTNKVSCIMASSMSPEVQKTFENTWAYEMNQQLKEMFQAKANNERLDVVKSLMAYKPKPGASICAFRSRGWKGYFDRDRNLEHGVRCWLSINIILSSLPADYNQFVLSYQMNRKETSIMELCSLLQTAEQGIKKIDVPSTSAAPVLTVGHNAKKRKTSNSNWKGKAAKGKSDRGSKRKVESEIAPTSDPKKAVCFYYNTKGHWRRSCPKYLKDLKDGKVKKGSHSGNMGLRIRDRPPLILNLVPNKKVSKTLLRCEGKTSFSWAHQNLRGVFLEREIISKKDSGGKIDLEEIQESADEEPIVNIDTQPEVVTPVEPNDISLPIRRTSGRVSKPPQF
ncbi:retrotransposon protein, putative, ty1-copia subclass [Tanacetum coccineum]